MAGRGAAGPAEEGHHRQSDPPVAALPRNGRQAAQVAAGGVAPARGGPAGGAGAPAAGPSHAGRGSGEPGGGGGGGGGRGEGGREERGREGGGRERGVRSQRIILHNKLKFYLGRGTLHINHTGSFLFMTASRKN